MSWSFVLVLIVSTRVDAYPPPLKDIYVALEKVLDYVAHNWRSVNMDEYVGIVFCQANLKYLVDAHPDNKELKTLHAKADDVLYATRFIALQDAGPKFYKFFITILDPLLWMKPIDFRNILENEVIHSSKAAFETVDEFIKFLAKTNLTEHSSDLCLRELTRKTLRKTHLCPISKRCGKIMLNMNRDVGYGLTHRLLFLQVAAAINCALNKTAYDQKVLSYCSDILWEARQIEVFGFDEELDDLFLEQVTLCGFEGFGEFFKDDFVRHILEIQQDSGCFTASSIETRAKRWANVLDDGCVDHTTGLGASALSFILRYYSAV